jgi:hypothetical protein
MYDAVIMTRVTLRQSANGRWEVEGAHPPIRAATRERCLTRLRKATRGPLLVETLPALLGVAEAAALLGWDKRRVSTYVARGSFPEPLAVLAGGRVWALDDLRAFARARRRRD